MTDKPLTVNEPTDVRELTRGIERTRSEMSATIVALEQRLSPAELGEQAKAQLEQFEVRAKALIKEGLDDAKGSVARSLEDAKENVKKEIQTALVTTRHAVREATIGRVEDLATQAGDVMNDTRDTLVETIRQNPIPAALAGIGIAWLLMNRSSVNRRRSRGEWQSPRLQGGGHDRDYPGSTHGYEGQQGPGQGVGTAIGQRTNEMAHQVGSALGDAGEAVSGAAHDAGHAVSGVVGQGVQGARRIAGQTSATAQRLAHGATDVTGRLIHGAADTAGQIVHQTQELVGNVAHTARDQAWRAERGMESSLRANPLAVGAVAVAVGAAVGYALPRTRREDVLLGEARDRLLRGATDLAHEATHSLHQLTENAGETAKKAVSGAAADKPG